MKETKTKQNYCAPLIEVLSARVEKGFQTSSTETTRTIVDGNPVEGAGWTMGDEAWFN